MDGGAGSAGAGAAPLVMRGVAATWAAIAAIAVPVAMAGKPALRQENVSGYGVVLKVPSSWVALDASKMKLARVAYAVADPKTVGGFHANLNLLVTPIPAGTTIRQWLLGKSAKKYLAIGTLKTIRINGETALAYESSKLEVSGGLALYTLEYAFNHDGKAYLFTYTAPASAKARFAAEYKASAATIKFIKAPPGA
jgi:hypothetical protein